MIELAVILLTILLFIAGLGAVGVMVDRMAERKKPIGPTPGPHELLDIRLARGEIGEADYLRLKHVLTYGPLLDLPEELTLAPKPEV